MYWRAEPPIPLTVRITSVNENEPIVKSPEQVLDCFFRMAMDAVVVENTLLQRQPVEAAAAGDPSD